MLAFTRSEICADLSAVHSLTKAILSYAYESRKKAVLRPLTLRRPAFVSLYTCTVSDRAPARLRSAGAYWCVWSLFFSTIGLHILKRPVAMSGRALASGQPSLPGEDMSIPTGAGAKRKRTVGPKFYAVRVGHKPGVYHTYDECLQQVKGCGNASCKNLFPA